MESLAGPGSIRGLYAVTPETEDTDWLCARVQAIVRGGATLVQYRNKTAAVERRVQQARALRAVTRAQGALLIINDDLELALQTGADGVHLGRDDAGVDEARRRRPGMLIGASCYDQIGLAERALASGADYIAFGSAFPSPTKPQAVRAPLSLYGEAKRRFRCPVVAIGGINAANAAPLIAAGADALAVISALFDAADPQAAAAELVRCFSNEARASS
jgi:thiamine-phosphate pyrophosphorylase